MPKGPFGGPRPFAQKEVQPSETNFDVDVSNESIRKLYMILNNYNETLRYVVFKGHTQLDLILMAFRLEKPVTSIELYPESDSLLSGLEEDLSEFFFVYRDDKILYVSRFRTLIEVIENQDGLSDSNADLAGILFGFSPENVAGYINRSSAIDDLYKEDQ